MATDAEDQDLPPEMVMLRDALLRNPEGYAENRDMAFYLAGRRDPSVAEPFIAKALSHGINNAETERLLFSLAACRLARGDFAGAADVYGSLHAALPEKLLYLFCQGDARFRAGEADAGTAQCGAAIEGLRRVAKDRADQLGEPLTQLIGQYSVVCQAFGEMAAKLDLFAKARALGWIDDARVLLPAPASAVSNRALLEYWSDHVTVVDDDAEIQDAMRRYVDCWLMLDYVKDDTGKWMQRDLAHAVVQDRWEEEARPPILSLKDNHREQGRAWLRRHGVPDDVWFATVFVREAGYYDEDAADGHNKYRNGEIANYQEAMREIVGRGGWVVRIGDPSMTPLPPMRNVIDYATDPQRYDWLDLFLCAECRFFVGTDSGPYWVPGAFGVPVVSSDRFPYGIWPVSRRDLFIIKPLRMTADGRPLTIEETVRPEFFGIAFSDVYESRGITVDGNSADEIRDVVIEMIERLDGTAEYSEEDDRLQADFKARADLYGVGIPSRIGRNFLRGHAALLRAS